MQITQPQIFIIGETKINHFGMRDMLNAVGATKFNIDRMESDAEQLVEVAGRLCYKSFEVGLNANVTKVREGNKEYIGNILKQQHGSVLEHASTSVAMIGVSRILTHELVRHRPGSAYSQESMRFVRMDDIPIYIPDLTRSFTELADYQDEDEIAQRSDAFGFAMQEEFKDSFTEITRMAEAAIFRFTQLLDHPKVPFSLKKKITSALRRMAPGGHTTNIIATGNHRAWRHWIETRTSPGAEEEIVRVFGMVAEDFSRRYKNFYQDMTSTQHEDNPDLLHWHFQNSKI